jgi:hypothetical protein
MAHADLTFSLMRLSPPRHIISNIHPDPNEHCIGHQTTHNDHANHDSTRARTRSVTAVSAAQVQAAAQQPPCANPAAPSQHSGNRRAISEVLL